MIASNTPLNTYYTAFQTSKPVILFINDGRMFIFFLLAGLEIKRELLEGELNSISKATLPTISAIGGIVVPAIIYFTFNRHNSVALRGWAIPTATDIAFSLAIFLLLLLLFIHLPSTISGVIYSSKKCRAKIKIAITDFEASVTSMGCFCYFTVICICQCGGYHFQTIHLRIYFCQFQWVL